MNKTLINPNYNVPDSYNSSDSNELDKILYSIEELEKTIKSIRLPEPKGEVEVVNFDVMRLGIHKELKAVIDAIKAVKEAIPEPPKTIEVSNFPKTEKAPDTVKVNNLDELGNLLTTLIGKIDNLQINPVVNVPAPIVNIPEQPQAIVNVPQALPPIVDLDLSALLSALKPLGLLSRDPNRPITVRMSDGRHFIDAIANTLKENGEKLATVVSTSYGLTKDEYKAARQELDASAEYAGKIVEVGDIMYVAKASAGSLESESVWQCKKIDMSSGIVTTWADGNAKFDNVATDLTALTYA